MAPDDHYKQKAVARWLLAGVAMLIIQILLGGITRLTGSGLSITEWKPIMGAIPPLTEAEWQLAFDKYKHIAQYKYLNAGFTLSDFKSIFFWEWLHREWARLGLSLVFAIGFIYFLVRRYFDREMIFPFVVLFVLGGIQGAIGWIMVKSGLNDTDLYVSHIKLAVHFVSALILLCYTLWFALKLLVPGNRVIADKRQYNYTVLILVLLGLQLFYGAFMAGLKAGPVATTWPQLNGYWLPQNITAYGNRHYSGIGQFISHPIVVQFIHRTLAYLLLLVILLWFLRARRIAVVEGNSYLASVYWWPLAVVALQVLLGILTVVNASQTIAGHWGKFETLAELHQLVAMFLLMTMIVNLYAVKRAKI